MRRPNKPLSNSLNKVINNVPPSPDLGMGVLLINDPLPPTVSPPYMTFCRVWRGVNPLCNIFTKNFQKNFWENLELFYYLYFYGKKEMFLL